MYLTPLLPWLSSPPDNVTDSLCIHLEPVIGTLLSLFFLPAARRTAHFNTQSGTCSLCTLQITAPRRNRAVKQQRMPRANCLVVPGHCDTVAITSIQLPMALPFGTTFKHSAQPLPSLLRGTVL